MDERGDGSGVGIAVPGTGRRGAERAARWTVPLPRLAGRLAPPLVALALAAPSFVFVAIDRSIWNWDDSWYGQVAVDLWATFRQQSLGWWHSAMVHAFETKPPAISWIGQFFVPLHGVVGSYSVALKLSVVLAQAGVLLLLYVAGRRAGAALPAVLVALLLVAASPLFVDLSHYYMVEQFQTFAVAWSLLIMVSARRWHPWLTAAQVVAVASFGLLVKISTPVYLAAPALVGLGLSLLERRRRRLPGWWREPRFVGSVVLALVLAIATAQWYETNWSQAIWNTRFSTSNELLGTRRSFFSGLWYWLGRLGHGLFLPWFDLGLIVVIVAAVALGLLARRRLELDRHRALYFVASVAAAVAAIVGLATQINDQDRFLLAAFPCLGLALALLVSELRLRLLPLVCGAVLLAEFGLVTAWSYSPPRSMAYYFAGGLPIGPPAPRTQLAADLDRIVELTCTSATADAINVVGVDFRWLNHNNLELLAHERYALSGRRCRYASLGFPFATLEQAWRAVARGSAPFYIGVDYGNPGNPLPADLVASTNFVDVYNRYNAVVFGRVLASGRYRVVPGTRHDGLIVLRLRS